MDLQFQETNVRPIALLFLLFLGVASAATAESSHEAAARELFEVSDAAKMIDTIYDSMQPQFAAMSEQMGIDESLRPVFDRHMVRVMDVLREEFNWEKMEPHMISAYMQVYSEEELLELVEFYKSPIGQKFLSKMPELMEVSMGMTQQLMGGFYGRLEELQAELQADIEASKRGD